MLSFAGRRASASFDDGEPSITHSPIPRHLEFVASRATPRVDKLMESRLRGPPTPNMNTPAELDESYSPTHSSHDPPPPPTPAASPGPEAQMRPDWSNAIEGEDHFLSQMRQYFKDRSGPERNRILGDLLNMCTSQQLSFVSQYVSPLLKKDPFTSLPDELCLRVCHRAPSSDLADNPRCSLSSMTARCWPGHHKYRGGGEICWPMI